MYTENVGVLDESLQGTLISGDLTLKRDAGRCARQKWMATAAEGIAPPSLHCIWLLSGMSNVMGREWGNE